MENTSQTKKSNAKKAVKIVLNVVLWIFLIFAFLMMLFAFASVSNDYGVPILGDKVILNVVSDSMNPTFKKGDMLAGKTLSLEEKKALEEGEIITFFADINGDGVKEINTHRIVKKTVDGETFSFRTKGDNAAMYPVNVDDDGYSVRPDDIICTWKKGDTQIHGLGSFLAFMQSRTGFLCLVVIPLILFFLYEIVRFFMTLSKVRGPRKAEISQEEKDEIRRQAIEEYKRSLAEGEGAEESKDENDKA